MKRYNIVIADDHIVLRDALCSLLNAFDDFRVLDAAGNGRELIRIIEMGPEPDIVLLDLNMPQMDGYAVVEWLHRHRPLVKVLVLTMYDSEIAMIRLLKLGVKGFLKKDVHPAELKTALLCIAENGCYYSHSTTGRLAAFFQRVEDMQLSFHKALLSDAELRFLRLASTELTYKEIAHAMGTTPRTIDGYRDDLFEKLNVKSRVGLAIYAVKNGISTF